MFPLGHLGIPIRTGTGVGPRDGIVPSTIVEARKRLGPEPVMAVFRRTTERWAIASATADAWRGLALLNIDGTTLRIPDSDGNAAEFGLPGSRRGRASYPQARLVTIMSVCTHLLVDAAFGPCRGKGTGELPLAHHLCRRLPPGSLLIGDKQYLAYSMLHRLTAGNADDTSTSRHWLVPAKKNTTWTVVERLGPSDAIVELKINDRDRRSDPSLPATIRVRAVRYERKGFRTRTLLTSLLDPQAYPAGETAAVFRLRDEIELAYDELKTHMLDRQETLRSKLPCGVRQEIWGILTSYNLVRYKMVGVAKEVRLPPLRVSFRHTLQLLRLSWLVAAWIEKANSFGGCCGMLPGTNALLILPERRPHRHYRRHVKIKMSRYPRNPGRSRTRNGISLKSQEKAAI